jgi:uncharacterized protein
MFLPEKDAASGWKAGWKLIVFKQSNLTINCNPALNNMTIKHTAAYWKERLELTAHIEGGAFSEVYRADLTIAKEALTEGHGGTRNIMTSIYFLLEYGEFSAFHRIASDELWHHYDGGTLLIYEVDTMGNLVVHKLGLDENAAPFAAIKAGSWFGSRVEEPGTYALCGCTVSPGFDFADFELAERSKLVIEFPQHEQIITQLTRT